MYLTRPTVNFMRKVTFACRYCHIITSTTNKENAKLRLCKRCQLNVINGKVELPSFDDEKKEEPSSDHNFNA